jgi:hypothetical protein
MFKHLTEVNKTYFQHFIIANDSGIKAIGAGLALIIHAFIPSIFTDTGSTIIKNLTKKFNKLHKHN